jgi:hypothetical protein
VLAAVGILAIGDGRAVPVLISALDNDAAMPFGFPQPRVWEKARFALLQSTGQDFGLRQATNANEVAATMPAWESWWEDEKETFVVTHATGPMG